MDTAGDGALSGGAGGSAEGAHRHHQPTAHRQRVAAGSVPAWHRASRPPAQREAGGYRGGKKGALVQDPQTLILYEDEMDLDWNPRTTRVWARKGQPLRVMTPGQNKKKTVFGAVSTQGRLYYSIQERERAVNFIAFLKHLLGRVAEAGQRVLMILDRYGIHTAQVVERFVEQTRERLQFLWLPAYCPNDNPQEKIWSSLQRAALHNCYHDSLAEREQVTRRYLARLQQTGCLHFVRV